MTEYSMNNTTERLGKALTLLGEQGYRWRGWQTKDIPIEPFGTFSLGIVFKKPMRFPWGKGFATIEIMPKELFMKLVEVGLVIIDVIIYHPKQIGQPVTLNLEVEKTEKFDITKFWSYEG